VASRRLIDDRLYDNSNHQLQSARSTLRIRRDGSRGILTFKGPVQPGPVKTREEIETGVGDVEAMTGIVTALGYAPFFRAQKYREEFEVPGTTVAKVALDETPMGVYVEIEAEVETIAECTRSMGKSQDDYVLSSYQGLYTAWATARGLETAEMLF
jgi:adenylate cyclase class 2